MQTGTRMLKVICPNCGNGNLYERDIDAYEPCDDCDEELGEDALERGDIVTVFEEVYA